MSVTQGPGSVDQVVPPQDFVIWRYQPTAEDTGTTVPVEIAIGDQLCGDWTPDLITDRCQFYVKFGSSPPPYFDPEQKQVYVTTTGEQLNVSPKIIDSGFCPSPRFSYFLEPGNPDPPGYLDSLTGTFHYQGTAADTGHYYYLLVMQAGSAADTMGFSIYHYDQALCGDVTHNGTVDVADLTWLINYLFVTFDPPPIPMAAGDLDCGGVVDVSDLTALIDAEFISFTPPCANCQ
ncbi:MAG: hypothetical protein D6800_11975 [Candidatus Zixiibacteriota bacterium]|nr:MAG: hypothetical protein D6800_11975 [candidate division Zixibacteria bacterium]